MPLPANVSTCTITGTFVSVTGVPSVGTVSLVPVPLRLNDVTATPPTIIIGSPVTATLDVNGSIPAGFVVPATDDTSLDPVNWQYQVSINTNYFKPVPFFLDAPGGTTINLVDAIPST